MIVQPQEVINERYRIAHLLGQGGMGAVYQAYDQQEKRDVAIKILTLPPGESQLRFRREFRVMQRLRHEHIVPSYDSGVYDSMPFLVMQLIAGGNLQENFSYNSNEPTSIEAAQLPSRLSMAIQIAKALAYIHQYGIIHRDLKPDNIMLHQAVTAEMALATVPHIFLMDFGLVKTNAETVALTAKGMVMGTVGYMSPEQAQGRVVDARSDLYALGSLIYWLILGRPAYQGKSSVDTLMQQLREPPQALSQYCDFIPAQLDMVVLRLLEKIPSDRYNNATDVIHALRAVLHTLQVNVADSAKDAISDNAPAVISVTEHQHVSSHAQADDNAAAHAITDNTPTATVADHTPAKLFQTPLIGRDDIMKRLTKVLRRKYARHSEIVMAGHSKVAVPWSASLEKTPYVESASGVVTDDIGRHFLLQAETGMGVTRLLKELRREARGQNHYVMYLRQPQGATHPYHSWQQALRWVRKQRAELFQVITEGLHDPLTTILPELGGKGIDRSLPAAIAQNRLHQAVDTLIARLAAQRSLVVIVDSLHASDQASLALLRYILRGVNRQHMLCFMGVDTYELSVKTREVMQDFEAEVIALQPLSDDAMRQLIRALLGNEHIDNFLEAYVVEQANGRPFFAEEILKALLAAKQIYRRAGAWMWDRTRVSLPHSIGSIFLERLHLLPPEVQATALAASAIGSTFHFEIVRNLLECDEDDVLDQLDVLLRVGFVREIGADRYRFLNALFREVLHNHLSAKQRYRYHERIATLLIESEYSSVAELADHYAETLEPDRCVPFAVQAGDDAEAIFANDISEKYYRLALSHVLTDDPLRHAISLKLGMVLERIGHWQEAEERYSSTQDTRDYCAQGLHALGRLYQKQGDLAKSERYLRDALRIADEKLEIYSDLGRTLTYKADLQEARAIYMEALALVMALEGDEEAQARMTARAQLDLGLLEFHSGNWHVAIEWLETAEAKLDAHKDKLLIAQLKHRLGMLYQELYQHDIAQQSLAIAADIYNQIGDMERGLAVMMNLANVVFYKGDYLEAEGMYNNIEIRAFQMGEKKLQAISMFNQGVIQSEKGEFSTAAETLKNASKLFEAIGFTAYQVSAYTGIITSFTRLHRFDKAEEYIQSLDRLLATYKHSDQEITLLLVKGEWYLRQGFLSEAETFLEQAIQQGDESTVEVVAEAQILMAQLYLRLNRDITDVLNNLLSTIQSCDDMALGLLAAYLQAIKLGDEKERVALEHQFRQNGLYHHVELFNSVVYDLA